MAQHPQVSILIPHFQTPTLTLLCLRLLRRHTRGPYETIVIDNGSADGSGELLRRVNWIRLLRREALPSERPALAHGAALNLAASVAEAPLVLTMHTDTMVLRPDWLEYLVHQLHVRGGRCAAVGSWKMEVDRPWRWSAKWLEEGIRRLRGRAATTHRYIRSHCSLYRRDALAAWPAGFAPAPECSAGQELHEALVAAGWSCGFLNPRELGRYVHHLNHATMALNAHLGGDDRYLPRTRSRAISRMERFFRQIDAESILADQSLDAA